MPLRFLCTRSCKRQVARQTHHNIAVLYWESAVSPGGYIREHTTEPIVYSGTRNGRANVPDVLAVECAVRASASALELWSQGASESIVYESNLARRCRRDSHRRHRSRIPRGFLWIRPSTSMSLISAGNIWKSALVEPQESFPSWQVLAEARPRARAA
jgi:hypothetical protein